MIWDYRVVRLKTEYETLYEIREVFCHEEGGVSVSEISIALCSVTAVGLALTLPAYLNALTRPVIDFDTRLEVEPSVSDQALQVES